MELCVHPPEHLRGSGHWRGIPALRHTHTPPSVVEGADKPPPALATCLGPMRRTGGRAPSLPYSFLLLLHRLPSTAAVGLGPARHPHWPLFPLLPLRLPRAALCRRASLSLSPPSPMPPTAAALPLRLQPSLPSPASSSTLPCRLLAPHITHPHPCATAAAPPLPRPVQPIPLGAVGDQSPAAGLQPSRPLLLALPPLLGFPSRLTDHGLRLQ